MSQSTATATPGTAELRRMSVAELSRLGDDSLRSHLQAQALVAHQKYQGLASNRLDAFLTDPECLRHPTRLIYEFGEMAPHQFAHVDLDLRNPDLDGRVIYLRPLLRNRPDLIRLAVAYMVPVINYGDVISDQHCLEYGSVLLGLMEREYYEQLCALADQVGAEAKPGGHTAATSPGSD